MQEQEVVELSGTQQTRRRKREMPGRGRARSHGGCSEAGARGMAGAMTVQKNNADFSMMHAPKAQP